MNGQYAAACALLSLMCLPIRFGYAYKLVTRKAGRPGNSGLEFCSTSINAVTSPALLVAIYMALDWFWPT